MREWRSQEDVEEEENSDGGSDGESQASEIEKVLDVVVEISIIKKIQYMDNSQIYVINTRISNSVIAVVHKAGRPAD